jgi:hypothetical protein
MLTEMLIIICCNLRNGRISFNKRECLLFVMREVLKLLCAKNYEVSFQLSAHPGEHMLMPDSLAEFPRNIEALKPFT